MGSFLKKMAEGRPLARLLGVALAAHVAAALAAAALPELADEPSFKHWANRVVDEGIHRAYHFGYDWLPFYLYVSKLVGLVYRYSGLSGLFGPYSRALTLLLKLPMVLLNIGIGWLVYRLAKRLYGAAGRPLLACAAYVLNPAIALATDVFGYQDALHTMLVFLAVYCLCAEREEWAPPLTALAFLTKPQAAPFLLPVWAFLFLRQGLRGVLKGAGTAALAGAAVLLPFLAYGEMASVVQMYLNVPRVHRWLTGCAHNIWWLVQPVPPFASDRTPLLFGLNGLTIGLGLFGLFCAGVLLRLAQRRTCPALVHLCAFLAFAFFMVVTEIHENHLYAMFPFLAVFVAMPGPLRRLFAGLTVTFALDLALTIWYLHTGRDPALGPVRISTVNAAANAAMLGYWSYLVFVRNSSKFKS